MKTVLLRIQRIKSSFTAAFATAFGAHDTADRLMAGVRSVRISQRVCGVISTCLIVVPLLVVFTIVLTESRQTPLTPPVQTVTSTATDDSNELSGTMTISLEHLVEQNLPNQKWFSDDKHCDRYATWFARPGSLPDARLVSFYRSGNTWVRYLLEVSTGFVTCGAFGTALSDAPPAVALPSVEELRQQVEQLRVTNNPLSGFIATRINPNTRTCVIAKTHDFSPSWRRVQADSGRASGSNNKTEITYPLPAILLIRDPFKAMISLRHMDKKHNVMLNNSKAEIDDFGGEQWLKFVDDMSKYWMELSDDWATSPAETIIMSYERLLENPASELMSMLQFLRVTPSPGRMRCVLRHLEGGFHNTGHPVLPEDGVFDQNSKRLVWERIHQLNSWLLSRGFQSLPLQRYSFFAEM